jgi:hypothetical protein
MHKEEFFNTLIGDEFISALIAQVKTIFKHIKIEEINLLIAKIEEGICQPKKEMTRFYDFLSDQFGSLNENDFLDDEDENLNLNRSNLSESELAENLNKASNISSSNVNINATQNQNLMPNNLTCCDKHEENQNLNTLKTEKNSEKTDKNVIYYASCNKKISFSMSTQIINEKPSKIANDVGLDELLEYIVADENPKKTNKKKNKKKKNSKNGGNNIANNNNNNNNLSNKKMNQNENLKNLNNNTHNHNNSMHHEIDQEVEMFKNSIKNLNSVGKKIKPNLSQEWIKNILKLVNAS